jgi:hypothetical protein
MSIIERQITGFKAFPLIGVVGINRQPPLSDDGCGQTQARVAVPARILPEITISDGQDGKNQPRTFGKPEQSIRCFHGGAADQGEYIMEDYQIIFNSSVRK